MKTASIWVVAILALTAAPALAQWTPLGGGDHTGWDYSPPNGAVIGSNTSSHTNVSVFTVLDGSTVATGGAVNPVVVSAQTIVIDGNIDAVTQDLRLDAETTTVNAGIIPTLVSPAYVPPTPPFAGATPLWDWNDITGAAPTMRFILQVSNAGTEGPGGTITGSLVTPTGLQKTGLIPSQYLTLPAEAFADGLYFWRVGRDDNNDGVISGAEVWSEVWRVIIDTIPPAAFTLLSPANGSCSATPTPPFDWTDSSDANGVTYRIQIDNSGAGFPSPEYDVSGLAVSNYLPAPPMPDASPWTWRVFAIDPAGNSTVASNAPFTVIVDTVAPTIVVLIVPLDLTITNNTTPLFDWTDTVDVNFTSYTFQLATDVGFAALVINQTGIAPIANSTFTPGAPIADGTYFWRVRAFD